MDLHIYRPSKVLITSCEVLRRHFAVVKVTEPEELEIGHACVGKLGVHLTVNCLIISPQIQSPFCLCSGVIS
jgi:hypothetical protein